MHNPRVLLLLLAAAMLVLFAGCPNRQFAGRANPIRQTVERLLDAMVDGDDAAIGRLISPSWLRAERTQLDESRVNSYSPESFVITSATGDVVTARLVFAAGNAHRIKFRVSEEQGKHYVVPGKLDADGWIHPWLSVETNIE